MCSGLSVRGPIFCKICDLKLSLQKFLLADFKYAETFYFQFAENCWCLAVFTTSIEIYARSYFNSFAKYGPHNNYLLAYDFSVRVF